MSGIQMATEAGSQTLKPLINVTREKGLHDLTAQLSDVHALLHADLADVNRHILDISPDLRHGEYSAVRVQRAAEHILALAGKRVRPVCVLLAARVAGQVMTPAVRDLAIACELVHTATLLHDDVIDEGNERRGSSTARRVYGNAASVLAGDHLLIHALRLVEATGHHSLMVDLLNVIDSMVTSEGLQLERRGGFVPDRKAYLAVIEGKTAVLFDWGLRAGGMAGDMSEEDVAVLGRAGFHLGMAFQLVDDVIDLEGDPAQTGKDALSDVREGKLTWPLILAAERNPEIAQTLSALAADDTDDSPSAMDNIQKRAAKVIENVRSSGALNDTRSYAREQATLAQAELGRLADNPARRALEAVAVASVERLV